MAHQKLDQSDLLSRS